MLDVGWSEMLVIAVVAVVVVGPKDLPRMLRGFGNFMGKMKRMSRDFQRQFNDALREAELEDVKKSVEQIGKIDPLADVKKELAPAKKIGDEIRKELGVPVPAAATAASAAAPAAAAEPGVNLAVPLNGASANPGAGAKPAAAAVDTPAGVPPLNGAGHEAEAPVAEAKP